MLAGALMQAVELFFKSGDLLVGAILQIQQTVPSRIDGADQFIQFEMERFRIPILGALD